MKGSEEVKSIECGLIEFDHSRGYSHDYSHDYSLHNRIDLCFQQNKSIEETHTPNQASSAKQSIVLLVFSCLDERVS